MNNIMNLKIAAALATALLAGCQSYKYTTERPETVSEFVGDAQAINNAKLAEDPWKQNSENTQINGDSKRLGNAVESYRSGETKAPGGLGSQLGG